MLAVMAREFRLLPRRPALAGLVVVLPLIMLLVLGGIFRAGIPTGMAVAVIDLDRSDLSRAVARMLDAAPERRDPRRIETPGDEVLRVEGMTTPDGVIDASFTLSSWVSLCPPIAHTRTKFRAKCTAFSYSLITFMTSTVFCRAT